MGHARQPRRPRLRTRNGIRYPVETSQLADPEAWKAALAAADGDHRRLRIEPNGTITVMNRPRSESDDATRT